MRRYLDSKAWGRLAALLAVIALLGIAPRPHSVVENLTQARRAISFGAHKEAAQKIAQVAVQMPWRSDLWEFAGREALNGGDPVQAIVYLEKASEGGGLSREGYTLLANAYQQNGKPQEAIHNWRAAIRLGAPPLETWKLIFQAQLACRDYGGAIASLSVLTNVSPSDALLRYQLGALLFTRQPELGIAHLRQAAEMDPSLEARVARLSQSIHVESGIVEPAYLLAMAGRGLASLEEWNLAAEAFRQAIVKRPDYAEAWAFWGEALQHLDSAKSSVFEKQATPQPPPDCGCCEANGIKSSWSSDPLDVLRKAVSLDPQSLSANTLLALYWQRKGDTSQAIGILKKVVEIYPDNPALFAQLGDVGALDGDLEAALRAYQHASELKIDQTIYLKLLVNFTVTYRYQVEEVGLPTAREIVQANPTDSDSLDLMGQVLFQLEDFISAEIYFREAVEMKPDNAAALLNLGRLYLQRGDFADAKSMLSRALAAAPGTPIADDARALLEANSP